MSVPWLVRQTRAEAMGLCVRCGGELDADGCAACRQDRTAIQDRLRDERLATGLCRCGRPRAEDRKQCPACLEWDRTRLALRVRGTRPVMRPVAVRGGQGHEEARQDEQRMMDRASGPRRSGA